MSGGEDAPEYSLGRLLISHATPDLTLLDLDTSSSAGRLPFPALAEVEAGASGRYGYAYAPGLDPLHVVDPGQWLLSHIDHFHVMRGAHRVLDERVNVPGLSSLTLHDGWVSAYAASSGLTAFFQERSITARTFAPTLLSLAASPAGGVALVSWAQLVVSDGSALSQRPVLARDLETARFSACSGPRGVAARRDRVYVGCSEGLLQLTWDPVSELFTPSLLAGERVLAVRTTEELDGVVAQTGTRSLVLGTGSALRRVELGSDLVAFELRRKGDTALALTADGVAHELSLTSGVVTRSTQVLDARAREARLVLSHAYAYLTDPSAARVRVLRLRTMQLESDLPLESPAHDLALVGMPRTYTDDRE